MSVNPKDLIHKLREIQDAQNQSRYSEARSLTYRLICETQRAILALNEKTPVRAGVEL